MSFLLRKLSSIANEITHEILQGKDEGPKPSNMQVLQSLDDEERVKGSCNRAHCPPKAN